MALSQVASLLEDAEYRCEGSASIPCSARMFVVAYDRLRFSRGVSFVSRVSPRRVTVGGARWSVLTLGLICGAPFPFG